MKKMNEQLNFMKEMINGFESIEERIATLERIIDNFIKEADTKQVETKNIMAIDEAADFIGYAPSTIRRFTHERKIPYHKRNKRLYFVKSELTAWMLEKRVKTADEIEKEAASYIRKTKTNNKTKNNGN